MFTRHGLNCLSLNSWWYYIEGNSFWNEDRKNAVRQGTILLARIVKRTGKYIHEVEDTLKYFERTKHIYENDLTKIGETLLLLWDIFHSDLGKSLIPFIQEKFLEKGLTENQTDKLIDYCFNFKHPLGYQQEQTDLKKIYLLLRKKYSAKSIHDTKQIPAEAKIFLAKHWKKYRYLTGFDLNEEPYSQNDFWRKLLDASTEKVVKRKRIETIPASIQKHLSKADRKFLHLVHRHIFFDNYAADLYAKLDFLLCNFLSGKYSLSFKELSWYSFGEVEELIKRGKKVSLEQLAARKKYRAMVHLNGDITMFYGKKEFLRIKKIVVAKTTTQRVKSFTGLIAFRGFVSGTVKIVKRVRDIDKLKTGEILVAPTTHPNLILAIKRCSGIITDTGGITSHAAVVSREFGIPCIVGTTIATRVLRDRDRVELDANNGVVNIIPPGRWNTLGT